LSRSSRLFIFQQGTFDFLAAFTSKFLATLLVSPITLLKTRFEVVGSLDSLSVLEQTNKIYRMEGLRGFYKGISPTLINSGFASGIQYLLYRAMQKASSSYSLSEKKSSLESSLFGAASSMLSIFVVYPFDNLRVRYQCNTGKRFTFVKTCRYVYNTEGFAGFFQGCLPKVVKKACSGSVVWCLYESFQTSLRATNVEA